MTMNKVVRVAIGVVLSDTYQVFITRRHQHAHQGGKWEFPGGKIEAEETPIAALCRELQEEIGIVVIPSGCQHLITLTHDYGDKTVELHVYTVNTFDGLAHGAEGQDAIWVQLGELDSYEFPKANQPIIRAIQLPDYYTVSAEPERQELPRWLRQLRSTLSSRANQWIQLRSKSLTISSLSALSKEAHAICREYNARLIVNVNMEGLSAVEHISCDGIHLTSDALCKAVSEKIRVARSDQWLAASCHHAAEIEMANELATDFIVISPVQHTQSHPDVSPIGWSCFAQFVKQSSCPAYALGGVEPDMLPLARRYGARGVAGISSFWGSEQPVEVK
tara:strand:- start:29 stop:1030 length:1002 start_codon:yes stop_codon:yes gene_type:complete